MEGFFSCGFFSGLLAFLLVSSVDFEDFSVFVPFVAVESSMHFNP